jgi:hypothetical protein
MTVFEIRAFDIKLYCKVTVVNLQDKNYFTLSFGGANKFCIIISISPDKKYIDIIEYNEACVKDGKLEESGGTVKLVKAALWAVKEIFHDIQQLKFIDDSHIHCQKGTKYVSEPIHTTLSDFVVLTPKSDVELYKLSLAYDYILKSGQTWYENRFNASLPDGLMKEYKDSLKVLDEPLKPFELIKDIIPKIEPFKAQYELSSSPRDFIKRLREEFKEQYCFKVGSWLSQYIERVLHIIIFKESWFIPIDIITMPHNFSIKKTADIVKGGSRKTRKNRNFRLVRHDGSYSIMGYADSFEK